MDESVWYVLDFTICLVSYDLPSSCDCRSDDSMLIMTVCRDLAIQVTIQDYKSSGHFKQTIMKTSTHYIHVYHEHYVFLETIFS